MDAKEKFKEMYFQLGGGDATGWGLAYWNNFFADDEQNLGMQYLVQAPETPEHTRMMITSDFHTREHRLFFLTEEAEERFFDFPEES